MFTRLKPWLKRSTVMILGLLFYSGLRAQDDVSDLSTRQPLNIIIASRIRTFDAASISFQAQAGIQKIFHRRRLYLVYVNGIEEAAARIEKLMKKKNARIKNLWFDSHGYFGRRVALFEVGRDEVNYQTIYEEHIRKSLQRIGKYCDSSTIVSLGSCYSGATFILAARDSFPQQRMNGDSLMKSISEVLGNSMVYASPSWVMTKAFVFGNSYALAGGPGAKKFHDPLLIQAWETVGQWTAYHANTQTFSPMSTVAMDGKGNIMVKPKPFLNTASRFDHQQRVINNLKPGNYSPKWFVKYRLPKHYR
ncbi:MAG: hypothetical protein EAZ17_03795 [Sphingobacteriales bacterium]|nr:MAG: hypothetical protein EAZ17_03795 [Sphingobacteriales bacterium]